MVNTRSKTGARKPIAIPVASPEPPKKKAVKPKTVRFSPGHQSRSSHREQRAYSRRSPSPRRDYVPAAPFGLPNVSPGYGLGYMPQYGYPPFGYPMGMPPMFAPMVDPQHFGYGSSKRSRHESTDSDDEQVIVMPAKRDRSKSSECSSILRHMELLRQ